MAAEAGRDIDIYVGGQTSGTRISCREKQITREGEPIDITNDDDAGVRALLNKSVQDNIGVSVSGVTKTDDLRERWHNGDRMVELDVVMEDGSIMTGQFYLSAYNETGNYQDAVTFEATFMSNGTITYTGAT